MVAFINESRIVAALWIFNFIINLVGLVYKQFANSNSQAAQLWANYQVVIMIKTRRPEYDFHILFQVKDYS